MIHKIFYIPQLKADNRVFVRGDGVFYYPGHSNFTAADMKVLLFLDSKNITLLNKRTYNEYKIDEIQWLEMTINI